MHKYRDFSYEKEIMGHLINFYRKKNDIKLYDFLRKDIEYYNEFCISCPTCVNKEIICTSATLYKIEQGKINTNDCYYYQLAKKLNKRIIFDNKLYSKINKYRENIKSCLISNSKEEIEKLLLMITKDLIKYHHFLYVGEILNLYHDVLINRYEQTIPESKTIYLLIFLISLPNLHTTDKELALFMLYKYETLYCDNFNLLKKIQNNAIPFLEDPLLFEMKLSQITEDLSLNSYLSLNKLNENDLNAYQQYLLNDSKAYICLNLFDTDNAYSFLLKNKNIIEHTNFCDPDKINLYKRLGIIAYSLKNYHEAIIYFRNCHNLSHQSLRTNYLIFFNILEIVGQINELIEIVNSINPKEIPDKKVVDIIIYYKKKYQKQILNKNELSELEDYICDKLYKLTLPIGNGFYKDILREELHSLIKKTQNYKKLLIFDQKSK